MLFLQRLRRLLLRRNSTGPRSARAGVTSASPTINIASPLPRSPTSSCTGDGPGSVWRTRKPPCLPMTRTTKTTPSRRSPLRTRQRQRRLLPLSSARHRPRRCPALRPPSRNPRLRVHLGYRHFPQPPPHPQNVPARRVPRRSNRPCIWSNITTLATSLLLCKCISFLPARSSVSDGLLC